MRAVHNPGKPGYFYDVRHPITKKPCKPPLMGYRFPWDTMKDLLAQERIIFGDDEEKIIELKVYAKNYEAKLPSVVEMDTRLGANELRDIFCDRKKVFDYPKPSALLELLLLHGTDKDSIILDSFAGSGTTAHAVLALNRQDGGNRRFVLVECGDYADSLTAERVRRVARGVPETKDESLKTGLGGTFSYFKLGRALQLKAILEGQSLPDFESLARYVFFTATGEEFDAKKIDRKTGFIGSSRNHDVFLLYTENADKLKLLALTLDTARALPSVSGKQKLVFAPTKYLDESFLDRLRITFCQLPFQIYKALEG